MTKTILSALALSAAMAFAAPVYAQSTMTIDGNAVPEAELEAVQAACATLNTAAAGEESLTAGSADESANTGDASADSTNSAAPQESTSEAEGAVGTIDTSKLTKEQCEAGGFYASM